VYEYVQETGNFWEEKPGGITTKAYLNQF